MPTVSHLTRQKPERTAVELDGDKVSFSFDRNRVTPAWAASVSDTNDVLATSKAIAAVLFEWDITNDDGSAFPPLAENVALFGLDFLAALTDAIVQASSPSSAEGNVSSPSSVAITAAEESSAAPSESFRNGSETFPSQNVSASPSTS